MAKTRDASDAGAAPAGASTVWEAVTKALFDPYRPELHYMRGPGPKWHEKHDRMEVCEDPLPQSELRAAY